MSLETGVLNKCSFPPPQSFQWTGPVLESTAFGNFGGGSHSYVMLVEGNQMPASEKKIGNTN